MNNHDDRLQQDLRAAFDGDDPGADFDQRVMADIEGGGGEHEISALPARSRLRSRWILVIAAAAAVLLIALLVPGDSATMGDPDPSLATNDDEAAPPPAAEKLALPSAKNGQPVEKWMRIVVTRRGKVLLSGVEYDWPTLKESVLLARDVERLRRGEESQLGFDYPVLIVVDKRARWREVQWVMQTCADPAIRLWNLSFAVEQGGQEMALSAHLPTDRGAGSLADKAVIDVELKRRREETQTRVQLLDSNIGAGESGFTLLEERLGMLHASQPDLPVNLHAWAWTPFEEVAYVLDMIRSAGYERITFTGAPPPKPAEPATEEPAEGPKPIKVPFWVRMLDGNPEIKAKRDREFEPFEDGLGVLIRFARWLKENGRDPTFVVHCEADVPAAVKAKILVAFKREGVTKVELK